MQPTHSRHLFVLCLFVLWFTCANGAYVQWKYCEPGPTGDLAPESLRARLDQSGQTARLDLDVSYAYHGVKQCQDIFNGPTDVILDLAMLGSQRRYQVAPSAVNRTCILPAEHGAQQLLSRHTQIHFTFSQDIGSLYPLSTFAIDVHLGQNQPKEDFVCISANITPEFGDNISAALRYAPMAIFCFVILSAIMIPAYSLPLSADAEAVSNAILPGVGDCLQYLQFIFFTGSLTLQYPGFFQPVAGYYSWAALFSPIGPIDHGFTYPSITHGIYEINGTFTGSYGLEVMAQVIGAPTTMDVWSNMAILMIAIAVTIAVLVQIRSLIPRDWKLFPLTVSIDDNTRASRIRYFIWTVLKIIFSYFLLPTIAISAYQLDNTSLLPVYHLSLATILIVIIVLSFSWSAWQVPTRQLGALILADSKRHHQPPSERDTTNTFVMILFSLTFARGATIGGLQVSALAQVVLLTTFELFLMASIVILRPFRFWSAFTLVTAVRAITVLLSSAFLPYLNTKTSTKSLIGYIILLLHAAVLVLCFLLPAVYRLGRHVFTKRTPKEGPEIYGLRELRRRGNTPNNLSQLYIPISHPCCENRNTETSRSDSPESLYLREMDRCYRPPRSRASPSHPIASGMFLSATSPTSLATPTPVPTPISIIVSSAEEKRSSLSPGMSPNPTISPTSQGSPPLSHSSLESEPLAPRWSDYTFRESDLYYGQPQPVHAERTEQAEQVVGLRSSLVLSISETWRKVMGKEESGFQVIRPPRPSGEAGFR